MTRWGLWEWVTLAGDVAYLAATVGAVVFVTLYATGSRWQATAAGRAMLGFMAIVAAILTAGILFTLWPGHPREQATVRLLLYTLLAGGMVRYLIILWRAQRAGRQPSGRRPR